MEIKHGLTLLTLHVKTANGEEYIFGIDRRKTIVSLPGEDKAYTLISSGPIAVGLELRGHYEKKTIFGADIHTFESAKVTDIVAKFELNRVFG